MTELVDLEPGRKTATRPLRIALVSEGAYPFQPGGVSLWCDQLVRGMPEHSFLAVALTVDGAEKPTWESPGNLVEIVNLPLWGRRRRPFRRQPADFAEVHKAFLRSFIPHGSSSAGELLFALRKLFELAQTSNVAAALLSNASVERLSESYRQAFGERLPLREATTATRLFEHMLRPLSAPPIVADVVHLAMNGLSALVGMTAKWAYGTPMLMSEHGVYLRERYLGMAKDDTPPRLKTMLLAFHRALAEAAYLSCDALAPHSSYNRRWQLRGGAEESRIHTMYNGIDPADFPEAETEPDEPTIVFVGRIDPLKDLHTLIRAFRIVRDELPGARLRMFGPVTENNRDYHAGCRQLVDDLGLTGAAVFEGRVPNQSDAYQAGHIVALTSISEGFPFTVVESMSTGRAQVCTNVGGVSEAVGDAGFVVAPRDHEAVARACLKLLTDDDLRRGLGRVARQRVLQNFTLQRWNDRYRAMYRELTGGHE